MIFHKLFRVFYYELFLATGQLHAFTSIRHLAYLFIFLLFQLLLLNLSGESYQFLGFLGPTVFEGASIGILGRPGCLNLDLSLDLSNHLLILGTRWRMQYNLIHSDL